MKTVRTEKSNPTRKSLIDASALVIPFLIYAVPALTIYQLISIPITLVHVISLSLSPFIFSLLFVLTAGLISLPFQDGIIPGRFLRNTGTSVYSKRRIYGTCWTTVYYCKPIYFLLLSAKPLKKLTFRIFGYKGCLDFTTYPDCWMRDLSVLDLKKNAYLSNRSTIGTNICHKDGTIIVGKISIGENSIVGHLAMIGPGVSIGDDTEIGVGCAIGINVSIGNDTTIGGQTSINHCATIGNNVNIGAKSYIGTGSRIADNIKIPAGALIPEKAQILFQEDANKFISSTYLFNKEEVVNLGLVG